MLLSCKSTGVQQAAVQVSVRGEHRCGTEASAGTATGFNPEMLCEIAPLEDGCHGSGEGIGIAGRAEEPGAAMVNHVAYPTHVARNDRASGRHRLDQRKRGALASTREHDEVGISKEFGNLSDPSQESGATGDPELSGPSFEVGAELSVPDDRQVSSFETLERLEKGLVVLDGNEPADDGDDRYFR